MLASCPTNLAQLTTGLIISNEEMENVISNS